MERVFRELEEYAIFPEAIDMCEPANDTNCLGMIKLRVSELLGEGFDDEIANREETIEVALDDNSFVNLAEPKNDEAADTERNLVFEEPENASAPAEIIYEEVIKEESDEKEQNDGSLLQSPFESEITEPKEETVVFEDEDSQEDFFEEEVEPNEVSASDDFIISLIEGAGIPYKDKRKEGGCLWLIGGMELSSFVQKCERIGYKFHFKARGGKSTVWRDSWWTK